MTPFLKRIASAFFNEYHADIRKLTFVFPNRRAGLFFQKYLTGLIERPIFSPEIITINDCFFNASMWQAADRTSELFRLYRIYKMLSHSTEGFDSFVFWGEMLLDDFNDVDKFRINAKQLFTNVKGVKEIDLIQEYLTEGQKKAIKQFWQHFLVTAENKTKEQFIAIWRILLPLYREFKSELLNENLAMEGTIFREVAEKLETPDVPEYFRDRNFVFVGFNALNPCERTLFLELKKLGRADFYWDYEALELQEDDNPASFFFKENTHHFPSKLTIKIETSSLTEKHFELISVPSSVGQAKEVFNLLEKLYPPNLEQTDWIKTAVVLPDESLLLPLRHSLPVNIKNINVTMGFPMKATPVSSLMESIFELHRRINSKGQFYYVTVLNILNHQYISALCEYDVLEISKWMVDTNAVYVDKEVFNRNVLLKSIFNLQSNPKHFLEYLLDMLNKLNIAWRNFPDESSKYRLECDFLHQYYVTINRMNDVMKSAGELEIGLDTLVRLIRQVVDGITIPFEGEPLNGLQVMGMLETRGLDFENLIICSFNEGVFPKKINSNSFIPNNLRRAFGLPTHDYHDAISAYNFYRLIHRAKKLFFLYDNRTDGMQTGEVSRYIHQLYYHYCVDFKRINVSYEVNFPTKKEVKIAKTPDVMEKLQHFLVTGENSRKLSASSINTYIDCPLQFYFMFVEQMKEMDEVQESIEASMFGTLLHEVMEKLYDPFVGKMVNKSDLDNLIKDKLLIDKEITGAFAVEFFKKNKDAEIDIKLEGKYLLIAGIIRKFVLKILQTDFKRAPFNYIQAEKTTLIRFPVRGGNIQVNLKAKIDRVDEKEGIIRVLDYKTGTDELEFNNLDEVFERNKANRPKVVLQTFLYSLMYMQDTGVRSVVPEVLKVRDLYKNNFSTLITDKEQGRQVENFNDYKASFTEKLTACFDELFNPEIPFVQCTEVKICKWCAFKTICKRDVDENSY